MKKETKRTYRIYKITNKITGILYIGYTVMKLKKRFYFHCLPYSGCTLLRNAIQLYGQNNFIVEEIYSILDTPDLKVVGEMEKYFIAFYKTLAPNGYNMRDGGFNGVFTEVLKKDMGVKTKARWLTYDKKQKEAMLCGIVEYVENKKRPIIGIHFKTQEIKKFDAILEASSFGYHVSSSLNGKSKYCNEHVWFYYDATLDDSHYVELAKIRLGGKFEKPIKNVDHWNNPEHRANRVANMTAAQAYKKTPLIGVNRFDASIVIHDSLTSVINSGFSSGAVQDNINGKGKHAGNYCWFRYDSTLNNTYYIEKAKVILGPLFSDINMKPFKAVDISTGEEILFNNLYSVIGSQFKKKEVRNVLNGRRKVYMNHTFKFI